MRNFAAAALALAAVMANAQQPDAQEQLAACRAAVGYAQQDASNSFTERLNMAATIETLKRQLAAAQKRADELAPKDEPKK